MCTLRATDTRERFSIVECPACHVLRTLPVPDDLAPFYATDLAGTMYTAGRAVHARLRRLLLSREARRLAGGDDPDPVLDVGCGDGSFALLLHRHGHRVIAVDAVPESVAIGGAIPYRAIDFERGDIAGLAPGRYTVVLRHVLEHVKHPRVFLSRLIAQGARRFYVVLPNSASLERRLLGTYWYLWDPPRHLWHFHAPSLRALCDTLGLRVVAQGYDTIPNLVPSVYRFLRLHGWRPGTYELFNPRGTLAGISAPLNLLLPRNVLWLLAETASNPPCMRSEES